MRAWYLLLLIVIVCGCKPGRKVNTSFYYWKTVYRQNQTEKNYLQKLASTKIYVRIMDVDMDETLTQPVPVSPIVFNDKIAPNLQMVPVVFLVNDMLRHVTQPGIVKLAQQIVGFVEAKAGQAGKAGYAELQIDCDWTRETRDNYFYLLKQLKPLVTGKKLSVTLRLHQIKNRQSSGVPPADKVMLMCYNMGNLRKYGSQNSIIEVDELKKYLGGYLDNYTLPVDVALPLFSWAVAFRDKQYLGIAKRVNFNDLNNREKFAPIAKNRYVAKADFAALGLNKFDEVRWEQSPVADLQTVATYLSNQLNVNDLNLVFFHLDEPTVKNYSVEQLEKISFLLR